MRDLKNTPLSIENPFKAYHKKASMGSFISHNFFGILFLIISATIFYFILKINVPTDIQLHSEILKKYLAEGSFPNPPLYYLSIYLLNLFFENNFIYAAVFVLSGACFLKFFFVNKYMSSEGFNKQVVLPRLMGFSLMFVGAIYILPTDGNMMYLGKFTSTLWHNSTSIFVFPFCIWLFLASLEYLKKPDLRAGLKLFGIGILILLAKPSFLFAFIVVFPFICWYQFSELNKWVIYAGIICSTLFIAIMAQKLLIYQYNPLDKFIYNGEISKVIVAPFEVWFTWAKNPLMNVLTSFLFIFLFILLKGSTLKKDVEVIYSFSLLLVSLFLFFTLAESGPRLRHGNFFWQIPNSMLIVNMVLLKRVLNHKLISGRNMHSVLRISNTNKFLIFIYMLHVLSGFYYVVKIFLTESFY